MRTVIGKPNKYVDLTTNKNSYRVYESGQIQRKTENGFEHIDDLPKDLICYFMVNYSQLPSKWNDYE